MLGPLGFGIPSRCDNLDCEECCYGHTTWHHQYCSWYTCMLYMYACKIIMNVFKISHVVSDFELSCCAFVEVAWFSHIIIFFSTGRHAWVTRQPLWSWCGLVAWSSEMSESEWASESEWMNNDSCLTGWDIKKKKKLTLARTIPTTEALNTSHYYYIIPELICIVVVVVLVLVERAWLS
jgi:hypothetical protein